MNTRSRRAHLYHSQLLVGCVLLLACLFSLSAIGQDEWNIDPMRSEAILSLASGVNAFQEGLARVSGEVRFNAGSSGNMMVSFQVLPENTEAPQFATMKFKSIQSAVGADGELMLAGELSVTQVESSIWAEPTEAYAGPVYGPPVSHTVTRRVALLVSDATRQHNKISLTGTILGKNFPEFLHAVLSDPWPAQLINDERCENPSTFEDYYGPDCTSSVIATLNNDVVPTGSTGAEDFYGFEPAIPLERDRATITLHLAFAKR